MGVAPDNRDYDSLGFLIIDTKLILLFVIIRLFSLLLNIIGLIRKEVIRMPLGYASAMFAAYETEVDFEGCEFLRKSSYEIGLVKEVGTGKERLSLNTATAEVEPYGEDSGYS